MNEVALFITFKQPYFRFDKETNAGSVQLYDAHLNVREMQILSVAVKAVPERYVQFLPFGTLLNYTVITYKFRSSEKEHTVENYDLLENTVKWLESLRIM